MSDIVERNITPAAAIERLRQIERSYIALHTISGEQQAEIERLRSALERIKAWRTDERRIKQIAREALDDE